MIPTAPRLRTPPVNPTKYSVAGRWAVWRAKRGRRKASGEEADQHEADHDQDSSGEHGTTHHLEGNEREYEDTRPDDGQKLEDSRCEG